jgi:hypothetical protein
MLVNIRRISNHATERLVETYRVAPKIQKIIALVVSQAAKNVIEYGRDNAVFVINPNEGAYVVKGDTVVTFIHKSRIGEFGNCQRAYDHYKSTGKAA